MTSRWSRMRGVVLHLGTVLLAVSLLVGAVALFGMVAGWTAQPVAAFLALATLFGGAGVARWAKDMSGEEEEEEREVGGPDLRRRRMIAAGGAAAGLVAVGWAIVPAARRNAEATERLRRTAWEPGVRLVDSDGRPVAAGQLQVGGALTVYPETAVRAADAQALLLRVAPGRLFVPADRAAWVVDNHIAYSRLCTHMNCPLGLYQARNEVLLCPCHQALFDVLDRGRVLQGPAGRPLPQLPLAVDGDGLLVAQGDFSDSVGSGFWGRPQ